MICGPRTTTPSADLFPFAPEPWHGPVGCEDRHAGGGAAPVDST